MERGSLGKYFDWVIRKKLSEVETNPRKSNQHELNAVKEIKERLGQDKREFATEFLYFEGEQASIPDSGTLTYYDARANHPIRTEHRIYYNTNEVTALMEAGDTLFLALRPDGGAMFIVASGESFMSERLSWLFDLEQQADLQFEFRGFESDRGGELDFLSRQILDALSIEYEDPNANSLDTIIERFGLSFPKTREFSDLARLTLPGIDARDDPDFALMAWLDHEEAMFRRLEKKIVSERLHLGFVDGDEANVDAFIKFSLSVQNRRKSRMGHSLENHISAALDANEVVYASQFKTIKGKKPDYLFPSAEAYLDQNYSVGLLTMLAAKSSCKERWSQVLSEADRIPVKHLLTLDPGIPETTTETMKADNLQLVVPADRHNAYSKHQRTWLMSLAEFIELVKSREGGYPGPAQQGLF